MGDTHTSGSNTPGTHTATADLPLAGRKPEDMPGHWLLARLGKRVLRPGGLALTEQLLDDARLGGAEVVELAPGLGKTAVSILGRNPAGYIGVEADPAAVALTSQAVGDRGRVVQADAAATGLDDSSADAVVGEAMLTMQSDRAKAQIVAEAHRVLRPGGRYAIHELALNPDTLSDDQKTEIRKSLARSIKVNARPLTEQEWRKLFTDNGFTVEKVAFAPMALLEPRRVIADEGVLRTLRFVGNVIRNPKARKRILGMRATFTKYRDNLAAIEIVAAKDGV
ncbi:methyltransferase domain-containing protein [Gordonia pseudamarae]|jgi:SAM-dependent methyltransferase|uniref:Methyltransferase domain-containing protein n=1 Tax=Gordonia pseudamarae TaxID=2831662 RepID=A0ABX6ID10_9ACTN|nr:MULTISPECIES: class I SAM-dependent methyltransferase [Gordonia]MBD0022013.1 class I SAM-dependent methyltransferase [Gordonia sp. (in: high G+C Gram-positive bacteria)]QHN24874.1 methyltransferase domain-containing protein [Gordonia pseudamarae]QHN33807.1 methyltransferase domain-containing protein [Gordonia pseudamarae]